MMQLVPSFNVSTIKRSIWPVKAFFDLKGSPRPTKVLEKKHFIAHIMGKLRRFLLFHFTRKYVQEQLALRKGACRQCGWCCKFIFICPLMTLEGQCLSYGQWRWAVCKVFPIDQRDIDEVALDGAMCGYSFDKNRPGQ